MLTHFVDALEQQGVKSGLRVVFDAVRKRFGGEKDSNDSIRLNVEIQRLRDSSETIVAEVAQLRESGQWNAVLAGAQSHDPGTAIFADEAFNASAESGSEAKRRLFGRYIVRRLQTQSDGESVLLSRAMRATRDLTETQLLALAATVLLHSLQPQETPFVDRAAAEKHLEQRYGTALERLLAGQCWNDEDMLSLGSIGALSGGLTRNRGGMFLGGSSESASAVDAWLLRSGVSPHDQLAPNVGTAEWRANQRHLFPTIAKFRRLALRNHADQDDQNVARFDINRLDMMTLTPLGIVIGNVVLEQLSTN